MKVFVVGKMFKWFERLSIVLERLRIIYGFSIGKFNEDIKVWKERVKYYKCIVFEFSKGVI